MVVVIIILSEYHQDLSIDVSACKYQSVDILQPEASSRNYKT